MRSLSASELLQVWEQGLSKSAVQRALGLLATACPQTPLEILAQLSIGQRDTCLLTLREWVFGTQLFSLATCPNCGDCLELTLNVGDLRGETLPLIVEDSTLTSESFSPDIYSVMVADYEVQFRLPNSLDLAAIAYHNLSTCQQQLLNRCILTICYQGESNPANQLPQIVQDAIVQRMAEVDPQGDMQVAMDCPVCRHQWQIIFDIVSFFWSEINAWASRILGEVHVLATAYGWREVDILAMSPYRRQLYLEMVGQIRGWER